MVYEQRPNSGTLFPESTKTKESAPDYTGNLDVDGKIYRIAAWKKQGRSEVPFLSLSISEPREQQSGYESFERSKPTVDVPLEDISTEPVDLSSIPF